MLKAYACIWSNKSAAEMVKFYKSVFKGTKVGKFAYWGRTEMWKMKKLDIKKLKAAFDGA